jgi:ATP-dependent Lhr-like helicase
MRTAAANGCRSNTDGRIRILRGKRTIEQNVTEISTPKLASAKMEDRALEAFHPIVRAWFLETLGHPSAPQRAGWPAIASGDDALILAPTGTGKTLAAFLWELNALITDGLREPLPNSVHLLYISPLKALNNDVQRNLELPLAQLKNRFERAALGESGRRAKNDPDFLKMAPAFPEIRVGVRTGDTTASARAKMLRRTPHILITTPESLHILLTSVRGRTVFSALRAVIVDEIHAVAGTKRGAHLSLTLERLARVAPEAPQRIGLSATQKPLDEIARFLGGCETPAADGALRHRPVTIVDCGLVKRMETRVVSPVPDLAHVDGTIWTKVAPLVLERIRAAHTTLVFVNNRGQSERMAARINTLAGEEVALPYHGSLSRERRFLLEERLKAGELRALVTTSSLELGIDVGSVDLVVQLQSPKRVSAALQRVGRAGHSLDAVSRGLFVPTFRDDALEQLAILDAMRTGDVEPTRVVKNALDVLAQIIVAMVASELPEWTATDLYAFVRRAYPYEALTRMAFDETLAMLSGKYPSDLASELQARISWDRVSDALTPARSSRLVATISGGTIPDRGLYTVHLSDKTRLGELDEEFVHESRVGDAFQLGSSTWRITAIEHDRVIVIPAPGAAARMPFWHGEFMARSAHLAPRIGELRRVLDRAVTPDDLKQIAIRYNADEDTVRSLAEYVQAQRDITHGVPDDTHLVLEQFRDEVGAMRLVLHAPFGGRVNAPWGMALARRARERLGVEIQVQTTDDGLMLRLPDMGAEAPVEIFRALSHDEAERLVLEEVGASSLFGARFRMNAARALLLPRGNANRRMPLWLQRLKALDLLQAVKEYPSFPIVVETYRDVLQDAFDMHGLRSVLERLGTGAITIRNVETQVPSPFASSLQFGFVIDHMYGDDTPRAEQRATLLSLDRVLLDELLGGEGADDATLAVLAELLERRRGAAAGRQARDADELAVLVDRAGDLTWSELGARVAPSRDWTRESPLEGLLRSGRLIGITLPGVSVDPQRFVLVDSFATYQCAFGAEAVRAVRAGVALDVRQAADVIPQALRHSMLTERAARREVLGRWMSLAGVFSLADAVARYGFDVAWVERRITMAEQKGMVVRGVFGGERSIVRWCSRRLLEQARRRELAQVRKQVEAVPLDRYAHFLQRWQHVAAGSQFTGGGATSSALAQLYGVARSAEAWERDILPARVASRDPLRHDIRDRVGSEVRNDVRGEVQNDARTEMPNGDALSRLASSGAVVWAADARKDGDFASAKVGRVRFFERGTGALWLADAVADERLSGRALLVLNALRAQGALFTLDLSISTRLGPQATRDALKELVAAGLVTNDTVGALRDVVRWQSSLPPKPDDLRDPARWLPADFTPSGNRPFQQRRPNVRRMPRWRRLDWEGGSGWGGRWALVHVPGTLGLFEDEQGRAERVARQWLARYGIVSRDWYVVERPAVGWRAIYHELKRLEFRGEVQRGYFVGGLAGAQFALPEAVELLRAPLASAGAESLVAMSTTDPANVYAFPVAGGGSVDALMRPRGTGALLFMRVGRVVMSSEKRGTRVRVAEGASMEDVRDAAGLLAVRYGPAAGALKRRDVVVDTIDGVRASRSPYASAFREAGFRGIGGSLRA